MGWQNLFPFYPVIAPVWAGFEGGWLVGEIKSNLERQQRNKVYGYSVRSRAGRWLRTLAVREEWAKVVAACEDWKREGVCKRGRV